MTIDEWKAAVLAAADAVADAWRAYDKNPLYANSVDYDMAVDALLRLAVARPEGEEQ